MEDIYVVHPRSRADKDHLPVPMEGILPVKTESIHSQSHPNLFSALSMSLSMCNSVKGLLLMDNIILPHILLWAMGTLLLVPSRQCQVFFRGQAVPNWCQCPLSYAESSSASLTTAERVVLHRHRAPTFSHRSGRLRLATNDNNLRKN